MTDKPMLACVICGETSGVVCTRGETGVMVAKCALCMRLGKIRGERNDIVRAIMIAASGIIAAIKRR